MARLPKPLIGLLLGTVAFFAIWVVALKPTSSSNGGSQGGVGQYQSAINKAHQAVTTSNQANAKLGAPTSTAPAAKPATPAKTAARPVAQTAAKPAVKAAPATKAQTADKAKSAPSTQLSPAQGVQAIQNAIRAGKVVAVLFYNDAAADDRAVESELAAVSTHGGNVVKLAVPVSQLTKYSIISQQIPVVTAPTLVLIDAARQATTITGYADPVEIAQRIDDALVARK